ncbi:MAG: hypothetical protein LBU23_07415 [Planctomycetota bacterium]|jgi:hypothetical protein|nr:hypothetical protein [Planctomycetota bacterium]
MAGKREALGRGMDALIPVRDKNGRFTGGAGGENALIPSDAYDAWDLFRLRIYETAWEDATADAVTLVGLMDRTREMVLRAARERIEADIRAAEESKAVRLADLKALS